MTLSANRAALVAVDLGAQSCRVSLLCWNGGAPHLEVVHRFPNHPISTPHGLQWDLQRVFQGIERGLCLCAEIADEGIAAVGVDGWAVDYVRLSPAGTPLDNPFCYRDPRTIAAERDVHLILSPEKLYALTGIQLLNLNTLYQLYADKQRGIDRGARWLNIPEFITYRLGGEAVAEYTNATHTQLIELGTYAWCDEIFEALGLNREAAPEIVPAGSVVGRLSSGGLAGLPAFRETQLIVPACHDTASAIAAIPASGDDWAFISSGTWSLVGTVLDAPCVTNDAFRLNFTNLGGVGGKICFLKNVNGMWLIGQCLDEWASDGHNLRLEELLQRCEFLPAPDGLIDVDDPQLLLPGNMLGKINEQLERLGRRPFSRDACEIPLIANMIFHSLAARYAEVVARIGEITKKRIRRLFIAGGGSRNELLNRLTAERTGLQVIAAAAESTTIGNFAVQMATCRGRWSASHGVDGAAVAECAEELHALPLRMAADRQTSA